MKTILHLGAHRTGTTSFQFYLRDHRAALTARGIGFWGPWRTRKGLFAGVLPREGFGTAAHQMARAQGRIKLQLHQARARGVHTLLVSDENMMGGMRDSLANASLYPSVGERLARFFHAFDGAVTQVILTIRSGDAHWASVAAHAVSRGMPIPSHKHWDRIAQSSRGWRDVIVDLACAMPGVAIKVLPFERFAAQPMAVLAQGAAVAAPQEYAVPWRNTAPSRHALRALAIERGDRRATQLAGDGPRWMPFTSAQRDVLQERYADDMMWLTAGADGLAQLEEAPNWQETGQSPRAALASNLSRGHPTDGNEERHVARPG